MAVNEKTTEKIWHEYHERLTAFLRSRVASDAVDDILQDVFLKIHKQIDSLKDETKLESWLYQVTRNSVIDHYRVKKPTEILPHWTELAAPCEDYSTIKKLSSCLAPMIQQLPVKYRKAIQLSEIEGKTQRELAEIENISLSGAKSRVQRGRSILKGMLNECCEFELNRNNQLIDYRRKRGKNIRY